MILNCRAKRHRRLCGLPRGYFQSRHSRRFPPQNLEAKTETSCDSGLERPTALLRQPLQSPTVFGRQFVRTGLFADQSAKPSQVLPLPDFFFGGCEVVS